MEDFIKDILVEDYSAEYQKVYDDSLLLQYLDKKMKAVHGNSKTSRSLANIYAIYSILYYYKSDFYGKPDLYRQFGGYDYMRLFNFYRGLYARVNGSVDIVAAVRSVVVIGRSTEDPDERVMAHSKSNLAPLGQSILFSLSDGVVEFIDTIDMTADQVVDALGSGKLKETKQSVASRDKRGHTQN